MFSEVEIKQGNAIHANTNGRLTTLEYNNFGQVFEITSERDEWKEDGEDFSHRTVSSFEEAVKIYQEFVNLK